MDSLLFIYNAEDGFANALIDTGRRIFRPEAYPCALCMLTYGPFGMKKDWNQFVHGLPYKVSFLHKNELPALIQNADINFPCLVVLRDKKYKILIDGQSFNKIKDLVSLKHEVNRALAIEENQLTDSY